MSIAEKKLDRRRKYYCVLDCETATLPYASELSAEAKKSVAIAKPLIYDLGWTICDAKGNVYRRRNYLITEIFSVPAIFNTAYYASKRPIYLEALEAGTIELATWREASAKLEADLADVVGVGAYNANFDFKKAIPFTELYISKLYSADFHQWEALQNRICDNIASKARYASKKEYEPEVFRFRGRSYPLFDLWGLACEHILDSDEYRETCKANGWKTESGKYYKTSAETTFRFITGATDFEEAHTALNDAEIETEIFSIIHKRTKGKFSYGIIAFPFRIVGRADI